MKNKKLKIHLGWAGGGGGATMCKQWCKRAQQLLSNAALLAWWIILYCAREAFFPFLLRYTPSGQLCLSSMYFLTQRLGWNETFNNTSSLVQICRRLSICNCLCSHLWSAEFLLERYKENIWAMIFVFYIFFVSIFVIVFAFIFTGRMERRPIITCSASGRRSCAFASLAPFSRWPQINLISWPIFCICHWFCFFSLFWSCFCNCLCLTLARWPKNYL